MPKMTSAQNREYKQSRRERSREGTPWRQRELTLLDELYPVRGLYFTARMLRRLTKSVRAMVDERGLRRDIPRAQRINARARLAGWEDHVPAHNRSEVKTQVAANEPGPPTGPRKILWTPEEDHLLLTQAVETLLVRLPHRTRAAIEHRIVKLKRRQRGTPLRRRWRKEDDRTLETLRLQGKSWEAIATLLGRTQEALIGRWDLLKHSPVPGMKPVLAESLQRAWTPQEDAILTCAYRDGVRAAYDALGGARSQRAIYTRAQMLDLQSNASWTEGEINDVTRWSQAGIPIPEMAISLKRSIRSVKEKLRKLGFLPASAGPKHEPTHVHDDDRPRPHWTVGEDEVLRTHYASAGIGGLHRLLGGHRTRAAIAIRASSLGLTKPRPKTNQKRGIALPPA